MERITVTLEEELKLLREKLNENFHDYQQLQKEFWEIQGKINIHLETSIVRVAGYDKDILCIQSTMEKMRNDLNYCLDYIKALEDKKEGIKEGKKTLSEIGKFLTWLTWAGTVLFGIFTWIKK